MEPQSQQQFEKSQQSSLLAWIIWGIAGIFVLYQFLLQASISVMIPCLVKAFSINLEQVGFLSSVFFYTYIILQIPAGLLVDKLGVRKLLLLSILLCTVASGLFGISQHLRTAEFARLIMGLAAAPSVVCAMYLASHWLPKEKFALAVGLTEMLGMLGGVIGEAFLAQSIESVGWRGAMAICFAFGFLLLILAGIFVRDKKSVHSETQIPKPTHIKKDLWRLIRNPQIWWIGFYAGLVFAIVQAFASLWAVPYIRHFYNVSVDIAAAASAMIFLGTASFAPIYGIISNWLGKRKPVMYFGAGLGLLVITCIIYFPPARISWMFSLLFILGACCSSYVIPFALIREITVPSVRATALGFINMMTIIIGAPLLEPLIGYILHAESYHNNVASTHLVLHHNYEAAFFTLPFMLALAFIITFFIKETHCCCLHD